MAKKKKLISEFEKGWRVLVRLPIWTVAKEAIVVGEPCKRKKADPSKQTWIWVTIEGKFFQVSEAWIEPKIDEPYCVEFVKDIQQASLVRRMVTTPRGKVEREYITTPLNKRGYLKPLSITFSIRGSGWGRITGFRARLLDETYKKLTTQAASAGV